jgi:uncharacterized protein (TIGR03437 family)
MKKWIADNYPGTKTSITEYNLGQHTTLNSGLAEADLLGVFGREGLDYATMWSDVTPTDPISFAFQIYRNYDLNGSAFGDTSVLGQTDNQDQLAIYAAQRADGTVTAMVINKLPTTDLASTLTLSNFGASGAVQVWQYSNANLTKIVRGTDLSVSGGVINAVFPAYSMTMLVIPGSNAGVISSVLNAASLQPAIAPGTLVLVQGNWLDNGTAARTPSIGSSAAVGTTLGGVQVLFDGKAAPVLTVGANYATALVPYSTVGQSTTSVQVQTQAGLSAPFAAPLSATAPAVFTANGSGNGQALAYSFNPALGFPVANSALSPAAASGTLYFFLTGAGVLNPAMGDGSVGAITAQTPAQALTVTIGGAPATVISAVPAGLAALKSVSGILLVGVQVPAGTGEAVGGNFVGTVALIVTVGGASSPAGVTVAIH